MSTPVADRARELWLAAHGKATPRELVDQLAREGYTGTTENIIRAWKSRHRWRDQLPSTGQVLRDIKREAGLKVKGRQNGRTHIGGRKCLRVAKAAELAADVVDAATDDDLDPDDLHETESVQRLTKMQNHLGRMLGQTARAFRVKVDEVKVEDAADLMDIARAAALLADAFGRLEGVLVEARRSRFTAVDDFGKMVEGEIVSPRAPEKKSEPEPDSLLLEETMRALENLGRL